MNLRIETEIEDDGRWIAEVPELPGVLAYARCHIHWPDVDENLSSAGLLRGAPAPCRKLAKV